MCPLSPNHFQKTVLNWFTHHGRKNFPWQQKKTPYSVWVSEIMLQQTQVTTVIPYFERFMSHFPDLASLAQAQEDEVLHLWSGLGYYSRARNLHRSAKLIQQNHHGKIPADLEKLQQLPGIGRSTAGAILTCAFNKKAAILDGNVKRLLARFHGITAAIDEPKTQDQLWQLSEAYTPSRRVADYTQVMMDLGATLCTRKNPNCACCPLATYCQAYQQGIVEQVPCKKARASLPIRAVAFLILQNKDKILLEKRPATGIWGGLWSLPELPERPSIRKIQIFCLRKFKIRPKKAQPLTSFRHSFSHFHLEILPLQLSLESTCSPLLDSKTQIWYSLRHPQNIGLPAPVRALLEKIQR